MAACDNTLVHACLRMPKDTSVSVSSAVYTLRDRDETRGLCTSLCIVMVPRERASVASEVLSFLTCSSLIKASAILSWLPLITDTAWALPGLLCFPPQSHWRITAECLLPRPAWLSSMSHIDRANIKRSFFLAYLPADKKRRKIESQNFYIPVSSPSVFLSSCR